MLTIKFRLKDQYGNKVWEPVSPDYAVEALASLTGRKTYEDRHLPHVERLGVKVEKVIVVGGKELQIK